MAIESPFPPVDVAALTESTRTQVAATLASGIIAASGRPHSIQEALNIVRDIQFALYPAHGQGRYIEWEKTKDQRLNKIHV